LRLLRLLEALQKFIVHADISLSAAAINKNFAIRAATMIRRCLYARPCEYARDGCRMRCCFLQPFPRTPAPFVIFYKSASGCGAAPPGG
jgi:hypothetical protein